MHEIDERIYREAIEVLRCGPVRFDEPRNERGYAPANILVMLIHDGKAEEYREGNVTFVRLKTSVTL